MFHIGNAGCGRPLGPKNRKKQKKQGRPSKVDVHVAARKITKEMAMQMRKGVSGAKLLAIKALKKQFCCGNLKAGQIHREALCRLQATLRDGACTNRKEDIQTISNHAKNILRQALVILVWSFCVHWKKMFSQEVVIMVSTG